MEKTDAILKNHIDFQGKTQTMGAIALDYPNSFEIGNHEHDSHQLLYATSGVMRLQTETGVWIVPSDRAVYIPIHTVHTVKMYGDVTMRTLYINADQLSFVTSNPRVILVSKLMRELIIALSEEPAEYKPGSRGEKIAQLIEIELNNAHDEGLGVPMPSDSRLQVLCASLLANPADNRTLEEWSDVCGASPRTLNRLFESNLQMSFRRWRQQIRFHRAIESLSQGKAIAQVAYENGYRSPSAFSAAFHTFMGQPPSAIQQSPTGLDTDRK